jgi:hypothetical protein
LPSRFSRDRFQPRQYHHRHFPSSATLNWEEDPRLSELSRALKALGWVRQ